MLDAVRVLLISLLASTWLQNATALSFGSVRSKAMLPGVKKMRLFERYLIASTDDAFVVFEWREEKTEIGSR